LAEIKLTPEICEEIEGNYDKSRCFGTMAEKLQKPEFCKQTGFNNPCISRVALIMGKADVCDQIPAGSERDSCKNNIYQVKGGDLTSCESMTDKFQKELCITKIAVSQNRLELCLKLGDNRDACIKEYASKQNDVVYCMELKESSQYYYLNIDGFGNYVFYF